MLAGWFDDKRAATLIIDELNRLVQPAAVYVTLNPCNRDLLARAYNRIGANVQRTDDANISKRSNLLIDVDPKRPSGISSSDKEKQLTKDKITEVGKYLKTQGWPQPLFGDSGNGYHLIYKTDLPNTPDTATLVEKVLKTLSHQFSGGQVHVDTSVFNPGRITKIYGTVARKGDNIPERPHRLSRIIKIPELPEIVSPELLNALVSDHNDVRTDTGSSDVRKADNWQAEYDLHHEGQRLDVIAYLRKYGRNVVKEKQKGSSVLYCLEECVFDPSHKGNEAAIGQTAEGKLFYQCFHDTCKGKSWHDARFAISGNDPLFEKRIPVRASTACGNEDTDNETSSESSLISPPSPPPPDTLPNQLQQIVEQAAEAFAVPLEIPLISLLAVAGTCIGRTRAVTIKQGWSEHANLYLGIVVGSGKGKSPCAGAFMNAIFRVEKKWFDQYQADLKKYKADMAEYEKALKSKNSKPLPEPEKPVWKQLIADDATIESLADSLSGNPRGMLWYRDELSGLIFDLDKYSGKEEGTKARLISAYDSGLWKTNRVNVKRQIYIENACLSVFGTIQPGVLPSVFHHSDTISGFLPRFIFIRVIQKSPPFWTDTVFGDEHRAVIDNLVSDLLRFDFSDGQPVFIGVKPEAKRLYTQWYNALVAEPWTDSDAEDDDSVLAKLRGQCLRLCLTLHCMDAVVSGYSETIPVSAETMKKAIRLADWIKEHQKYIWLIMRKSESITEASPLDRRIIKAIVALEDKIKAGKLSTTVITKKVNENVSENFTVKSNSVGKVCKDKLKLNRTRDSKCRYVLISQEKLASFKSVLKNVTPVTADTNSDKSMAYTHDSSYGPVTSVMSGTEEEVRKRDGYDSSESGVTPENAYLSDEYDGCDGSDSFEDQEWETGII